MTIIRGGLSLPRPTAMNMPMPSSVGALRLDDVDPQAVLLGDGAGLVGEDLRADVVGGAVGQAAGEVRALADDPAALGGRGSAAAASRAGRDQDQLVERGRRRVGCPRGRSSSGRRCPRRRRGRRARRPAAAPPSRRVGERAPARSRASRPSRPTSRRLGGRGEADARSRGRARRPGRRRRRPGPAGAGSSPGAASAVAVALGAAARRTRRGPGARRRSAGRARRAGRRTSGSPTTGTTRTSAADVPRLIGDDAELHGMRPPGARGRAAGAGEARRSGRDVAASVAPRPPASGTRRGLVRRARSRRASAPIPAVAPLAARAPSRRARRGPPRSR